MEGTTISVLAIQLGFFGKIHQGQQIRLTIKVAKKLNYRYGQADWRKAVKKSNYCKQPAVVKSYKPEVKNPTTYSQNCD